VGIDIAAVVITLVAVIAGTRVGLHVGRRFGLKTPSDLPPDQRRRLYLVMAGSVIPALAAGLAIASGHPGVGIAILVVIFVLPEFVWLPLVIRRSRRQAEESRRMPDGD
jgi:hypothetical protein